MFETRPKQFSEDSICRLNKNIYIRFIENAMDNK